MVAGQAKIEIPVDEYGLLADYGLISEYHFRRASPGKILDIESHKARSVNRKNMFFAQFYPHTEILRENGVVIRTYKLRALRIYSAFCTVYSILLKDLQNVSACFFRSH